MMYKSNLDKINISINTQDELNKIAHQRQMERRTQKEELRKENVAEIEARKQEVRTTR